MSDIPIPTLWFDKDGVLAQYDYSIYEPENGAPAPWLIRNAHVFKNLEPYENMCEAFRRLYDAVKNKSVYKREMSIRVLTSVSDGLTMSEQVIDSAAWCSKYLGLQNRDFFTTAIPKESIPLNLKNEITKTDILLDDYNPNLRKWKEVGGTAIKIINGINSTTEEYPYFYNHVETDYLVVLLKMIVRKIHNGEDLGIGQIYPTEAELKEYKEARKRNAGKRNICDGIMSGR